MNRHFVLLSIVWAGFALAGWSSPLDVSPSGPNADGPQIGVDAHGNAASVWTSYDGSFWTVQASTRKFHGHWTKPKRLSEAGFNAAFPQIAVDPNGNATAVWQDAYSMSLMASTKLRHKNWQSVPDTISATLLATSSPQIAVDGGGDVTVVWNGFNGSNIVAVAVTKPYGGSWEASPTVLSTPGFDTAFAQVAVNSDGDTVAVWQYNDGTNWFVQTSMRPQGGSWQASPDTLSLPNLVAQPPQAAIDQEGNTTVVWPWNDGSHWIVQAATKPFGGSWPATPDIISVPGQDSVDSQIGVDAEGNLTVVWLVSQRANWMVQATARPHDGSWQATPDNLSNPHWSTGTIRLAVDPSNDAVAVWRSIQGKKNVIEVSKKLFHRRWQSSPTALSRSGHGGVPSVAVNSEGYAGVVWRWTHRGSVLIQSSFEFLSTAPPPYFAGGVKLKERKLRLRWGKSPSGDIAAYRIFARNKRVKTISARENPDTIIRLSPHHTPNSLSDEYRSYLCNKYTIRAVDTKGRESAPIHLNVVYWEP